MANTLYKSDDHDLLILFHTAFRNMALIISVTLGLLVIHRFHKYTMNNIFKNINKLFILVAMITIFISVYIGIITIKHVNLEINKINNKDKSLLHDLLYVIYGLIIVNIILFIYTLYIISK